MNLLYGKRFSKDLDAIRNESNVRKRLLRLIEEIKKTDSLAEVKNVKKLKVIRNIFESRLEIIGSE